MLRVQEYHQPKTIKQAVALLKKYGKKSKVIAGGTDVMVLLRAGKLTAEHLVSLSGIPGMGKIGFSAKNGLSLGPLVTYRELIEHPLAREHYPILVQAASVVAASQVRNAGTIAGNLCHASPAADMAPPLLALDAQVEVSSEHGKRLLELEKFFTGVNTTALRAAEVVTRIMVPPPQAGSGSCFLKFGLEIAMVSTGVHFCLEGGTVAHIRIALGAVAPRPMRAVQAEKMLLGKTFTENLCRAAAATAAKECSPITDIRGSAEYRRKMVELYTRRALEQAARVAKAA